MVIVGHICRETGKVCEYATVNGYCQMTACINHPHITVTTWAWQKPTEEQREAVKWDA